MNTEEVNKIKRMMAETKRNQRYTIAIMKLTVIVQIATVIIILINLLGL